MSSTPPAPPVSSADLPAELPAEQTAAADAPVTGEPPVAAEAPAADVAPAPEAAPPSQAPQASQVPQATPAETLAKLAELFPALFKGQAKPFKLRIQVDIQERAPGVFSKQALSAFFRRHTGTTSYLMAVAKGTQRFDLDGQPAGELSEEHRKVAADELARRRANANAKREQENAHREQEEAGRRQRASLLRDFETTKLTTANFCALKGVAADQLDALLAQARAEALEDAQRPRHPAQRPGHGQARRGEGPGGRRDAGPRGPRPDGGGPRGERGRGPGKGGERAQPRAEGRGEGRNDARPEGRKEGRPPRRG